VEAHEVIKGIIHEELVRANHHIRDRPSDKRFQMADASVQLREVNQAEVSASCPAPKKRKCMAG